MASMSSVVNVIIQLFLIMCTIRSTQGTLMPNGVIALDCGSQQTFTCSVTNFAVWTIEGLDGISVSSDTGEVAGRDNTRINTTETGVIPSSTITISGFSSSDNGGTIQCFDLNDPLVIQGMANISIGPLTPPANIATKVDFCNITLHWTQPSQPSDIATSVGCAPLSPGCAECTTSPCTLTGLSPSTEYEFTVTLNSSVCGTAMSSTTTRTISIPLCPTLVTAQPTNNAITVTWQQPPNTPPVTSTTVTYCPTSSPNCGNSITCTTNPCNVTGLNFAPAYQFTVIPNNNCGSPTGCIGNTAVITYANLECSSQLPTANTAAYTIVLVGIIPSSLLIMTNVISVVVVFLITRHCYKKTSQKSSPSKGEDVYDQIEGPKTYEDIVMTDSPAYGPVK